MFTPTATASPLVGQGPVCLPAAKAVGPGHLSRRTAAVCSPGQDGPRPETFVTNRFPLDLKTIVRTIAPSGPSPARERARTHA